MAALAPLAPTLGILAPQVPPALGTGVLSAVPPNLVASLHSYYWAAVCITSNGDCGEPIRLFLSRAVRKRSYS